MSNTKDIKDYLHLYLGCEAMLTFKNGNIEKVTITTLPVEKPERFKPILRPLSDMTAEEMLECSSLKTMGTLFQIMGETTKYLLSKHFDLFGLIEAGLALDKTNVTNI